MDTEDLVNAWRANDAVNHELLALCSDDDLELKPGKGKTIRSNFVHIIGVRRAWAETVAKKEAAAISRLDWKTAGRKEIGQALKASSAAIEAMLGRLHEKPWKREWTLATFFAYAVAHEAHHRSQIEIALRINGREPKDADLYKLWEWSKKA